MYDECVVAVYENVEQARLAVHILNQSDFPTKQVSLVAAHLENQPELETELNYGDDSLRDAFIGAGFGGVCSGCWRVRPLLRWQAVASLFSPDPQPAWSREPLWARCSAEWKVGEFTIRIYAITKKVQGDRGNAASQLEKISDEEACETAGHIFSMFLQLHGIAEGK